MFWYQARLKWAVMAQAEGLRRWEEEVYLFRSSDWQSACQRAFEVGRGGQTGHEEGIKKLRYVERRFAEVMSLDCLGPVLEEEIRVDCGSVKATQWLSFEHRFAPEAREPQPSF